MLNKKYKLNKFDFLNQKKGEVKNTPFFRVKIIDNKLEEINKKETIQKLGVIISKKFIKKANKRNALKRKICYAYLEINKNNLDLFKNKTLIISLIKKEINKEENKDKKQEEPLNSYQEIKKQIEGIII